MNGNKKKTIVLINGKSGSGKDYLTNKVVERLNQQNINALSYAHADYLKVKLSEMYNIDLKYFHDANKDNLYIVFNNSDLFRPNKVYTIDDVNYLINKYREGQILGINDLRRLTSIDLDKEYDDVEFTKLYNTKKFCWCCEPYYVSLRTLLVYYGTYIYKAMLMPATLQFESFNRLIKTEEFKNTDIMFVTDNRYNSEFEFVYAFAYEYKYNIKYIQINSDTYNKIDNIAENSFNIDVEDYIDLKNIMLVDNSVRTEEATDKLVSEIIDFILC